MRHPHAATADMLNFIRRLPDDALSTLLMSFCDDGRDGASRLLASMLLAVKCRSLTLLPEPPPPPNEEAQR